MNKVPLDLRDVFCRRTQKVPCAAKMSNLRLRQRHIIRNIKQSSFFGHTKRERSALNMFWSCTYFWKARQKKKTRRDNFCLARNSVRIKCGTYCWRSQGAGSVTAQSARHLVKCWTGSGLMFAYWRSEDHEGVGGGAIKGGHPIKGLHWKLREWDMRGH